MTVASVLKNLAAKEIADVKNEWNKYGDVEGTASITFRITENTKNLVEGEYRAKGMKMWTLEYGSGSKMDTSNPLLERYKNSKKYNQLRGQSSKSKSDDTLYNPKGTEIRTRPKGTYYDLDGNKQEGSGLGFSANWQYGLNAEKLGGGHAVTPIEPHHIIKDIIPRKNTVHKKQFEQELSSCIDEIIRGAMKNE